MTGKEKNSELSDDVIKGEVCPVCRKKSLFLTEREDDIPYFGKVALFSMTCESCKFHKSDVESTEKREPVKITFETSGPDDMNVRVVKSSSARVRIPYVADIEPGEASNGYVTDVEGILKRVKQQVEIVRGTDDDSVAVKKAKKMLKKINRIIWGEEKAKIIIEDPSGNSAIINEKAVSEKLRIK